MQAFSRMWLALLLSLSLLGISQSQKPRVKTTTFENLPDKFFYFEDSEVVIYHDRVVGCIYRSTDEGTTWKKLDSLPDGHARRLIQHPFDKEKNKGETWLRFSVDSPQSLMQPELLFNAERTNYLMYTGMVCDESSKFGDCFDTTYYTTDGFDSDPKVLLEHTRDCVFARSSEAFKEAQPQTILCVVEDTSSTKLYPANTKLLRSDDFFRTSEEVSFESGRPARDVMGLGSVQSFIVSAVKSQGTDEMAFYVTDDTKIWDRAEFPHDHGGLKEDGYTVLESTPYSIQVDITSSPTIFNPVGHLFTSNSNGTYFTSSLEYTNRNSDGIVDFEKVSSIGGIVLANQVVNGKQVVGDRTAQKEIVSKISYDDGHKWESLKLADCKDSGDKCQLHVHSVTSVSNHGRIFSSPAPGFLMAVGSTGASLLPYDQCDLYYSRDAGATWQYALPEAHKYEFGDSGSIFVAVDDEQITNELSYSLDQGKTWSTVDLGVDLRARTLTTIPDSTSRKFLLIGSSSRKSSDGSHYAISIDFGDVESKRCEKGDLEQWYARTIDGTATCIMGHKEYFWRRKQDAKCSIGNKFDEPEVKTEDCPCTKEDYECDYNFELKDGKCESVGPEILRPDDCKNPSDKYLGSSGYRLIPGNTCTRKGGVELDALVEKSCGETHIPVKEITQKVSNFKGSFHKSEYFYLERSESSSGDDETIILSTDKQEIYKSTDGGGTWDRILENEEIVAVIPHAYSNDWIFFLTASDKAFYSENRGRTINRFTVPGRPNQLDVPVLQFHPSHSSWLIWTTDENCDRSALDPDCHATAYYTKSVEQWTRLNKYVKSCLWVKAPKLKVNEDLVFCEKYENEKGSQLGTRDNRLQLHSSVDYFKTKEIHFQTMEGFAQVEEFLVVAMHDEESQSLQFDVSVDGSSFATAKFPHKISVTPEAYTVLDSITSSLFVHVTTNKRRGAEYGSLLKSNSNGTFYVLSQDYVNRDGWGYVDYETLEGLEGVAVLNVVTNPEEANGGSNKKIRTMITHNDGGEWAYLPSPKKDSDGNKYKCSDQRKCSLNLHGFTDRKDYRDSLSSASAIGLMFGVGNVGEELTAYADGDTFFTRDAGVTWTEAHKGSFMWEFGDQGSVVVIVNDRDPTDRVLYSVDEGGSWKEYIFAAEDEKMMVQDIATVPSDTSRKFLLFGRVVGRGDTFSTIRIDFTGLTDRKCVLDSDDSKKDDFEPWTPAHPQSHDRCLFGHEAVYHRRIPDHLCYIGSKIHQPHVILKNCSCTRQDYECDYNYQREKDGSCRLVPGAEIPDHSQACAEDKDLVTWYKSTGYRKIPLSTCQGGNELEKGESRPCPGKEKQYKEEKSGLSGVAVFFIIITVLSAVGGVIYFIWTRAEGRLGQIRLGEDSSRRGTDLLEIPVLVLSAGAAVIMVLPQLFKGIWYSASSFFSRNKRYTSRQSFSRNGYSVVDNFDDDLLADDE